MKTQLTPNLFSQLICSDCGKIYSGCSLNTISACCNKPLLAGYHIEEYFPKELIIVNDHSMWRYFPLLPIPDKQNIISLKEGGTPIVALDKLAAKNNITTVLMKDESFNPTGSFKARGMSAAVSKAKELGIDKIIIPTAGNAGGALAAYCAKANMRCVVVMPEHTPEIFKKECSLLGAEVIVAKGLIDSCAKKVQEIQRSKNYFDISTLKEPYRLEGKKTMGYEIAEQLNWKLPGAIVYPAGGGTGLIGIWKAFNEMLKLGWIKEPLPKMIAVQSENCAPIARAVKHRSNWKENFLPLPTIAGGLAVPFPFGMDLMLDVIDSSGGEVVTVTEQEIIAAIKEVSRTEGLLLCPEGAAAWKAIERLAAHKKIDADNQVLFLNTASGHKYLESIKDYL
jgi:threonine synthase